MSVRVDGLRAALAAHGLLADAVGDLPESVSAITDDSRRVTAGALFLAVRGAKLDGHAFLDNAWRAGATIAMVAEGESSPVPALVVRDTRRAAAALASAYYGEPSRALTLVGVTGTNGKTTTVGMLRHLLDADETPAASIGTLGVLLRSRGTPLEGGMDNLTTPGPVELQRVLRLLVDQGIRRVAMETSSHALDQHRTEGVRFAAGVFTNLTRDHLDYHGTMEAYFAAKALLVDALTETGTAVVNADDPAWHALPAAPRRLRFAVDAREGVDVWASDVQYRPDGSHFVLHAPMASAMVALPVLGDFNVANAVGAAAAALAIGESLEHIAARFATLPQVPGRLEILSRSPTVLRDYAHTPDALERCLMAVRPFAEGREGRLIVLFGCGGDRDRGKRPVMGAIAERLADVALLTSDNPRTEDPERILDDIEAGMTGRPARHERIEDRRAAIARALELAHDDDVVVLAGKGHETYQVRGTVAYPFDEAAIVRELLAARPGAPFE
ncbi:MAG: UDP-N-acetylmuramoyl-L-alanyl-D-glutamate--2,6-diaminopimelate ligase [Gemmatimonadaceae bacterium]|jgi:UDP-N-acetylmuramoyl-L-alanyl-D-glutamate--2,6-diaminopimelate ligase|nr:UDP-N-acetylmuramoyl-L-alanyl-D-glutamate--2,6-diaminopimelate ligase [Gemmatimonadaceae bacterium]